MADLDSPASEVAPYLDVIRLYEKAAAKWHTQGKKIVKRYTDERSDQAQSRLKYNILWANVETLKPAIYAKTPKPEVERRFLDKDPIGRVASTVLERCLAYYLSATPFGSTMRQSRTDYLLVGRGVSWVRYAPRFKSTEQITDDVPMEELAWEEVLSDYVHWRDFGHNVARTWEEVDVVWRIVYMTRDQMKKRKFDDWNKVALDYSDKSIKDAEGEAGKKAAVYEVWDKGKGKVVWLTKSHPRFLDERADPLKLDRFFPCSQPIYATLANESLIPVPDYVEYQDQAQEIDELTARISALQKAIKAAGVYDSSQQAIGRLLSEGVVNTLLPVDSWAALSEKGGLKGTMELLPMQEIAQTLLMLYEARDKVKQDLYEITGMSDIIRGATKASETATAQNLKNNYITLRLSEKQREMQRFARNTIEIMGNIICRHFSDTTIKQVSGVKLLTDEEKAQIQRGQQLAAQAAQMKVPGPPPVPDDIMELMDEPSWDKVLELLRNEPDRSFRIDIETDSTIEMDAQQDRQEAMEFIAAVGGFIKSAEATPPALAPLAGALLEFGVRKWRVGRELEGILSKTVEDLEKQAKNPPPPPPPDPAMLKVQADQQMTQQKLSADAECEKARIAAGAQSDLAKAALEKAKLDSAQHIEMGKQQMDAERIASTERLAQIRADLDERLANRKLAIEDARARDLADKQAMADQAKAELDARTKIEVAEIAANTTLQAAQIRAADAGAENEPDEAAEPAEEKPDPKMDALMDAHKQTSEHMGKALGMMAETLEAIKRPKKVVRDADGKLVGVE